MDEVDLMRHCNDVWIGLRKSDFSIEQKLAHVKQLTGNTVSRTETNNQTFIIIVASSYDGALVLLFRDKMHCIRICQFLSAAPGEVDTKHFNRLLTF